MRTRSGESGLVPVNYIDKLDTSEEQQANESMESTVTPQTNGGMDDEVSVCVVECTSVFCVCVCVMPYAWTCAKCIHVCLCCVCVHTTCVNVLMRNYM